MLPFLKPRQLTSIIIAKRKPEGSIEEQADPDPSQSEGLNVAAEDLIKSIHAKDAIAVAKALQSAMACMPEEQEAE